MRTILKLKYQKFGLLHKKEGKILFVRTQMAISYLGVVQVKNVTWIKYKWRLHIVHMF